MRTRVRLVAIVAAFLFTGAGVFAASTVRGRLVRKGPSGQYGAAGVQVTIYSTDSKLGRSAAVYTGSDGMYYLNNIPPGPYQLEVWISKQQRLTYNIQVRNQAFTDIAPIVVP